MHFRPFRRAGRDLVRGTQTKEVTKLHTQAFEFCTCLVCGLIDKTIQLNLQCKAQIKYCSMSRKLMEEGHSTEEGIAPESVFGDLDQNTIDRRSKPLCTL